MEDLIAVLQLPVAYNRKEENVVLEATSQDALYKGHLHFEKRMRQQIYSKRHLVIIMIPTKLPVLILFGGQYPAV